MSLRTSNNLTQNSELGWNFESSVRISYKGQLEKMLHHLSQFILQGRPKQNPQTVCDYLIVFWYMVYSNAKQNIIYPVTWGNKIKHFAIISRMCWEKRFEGIFFPFS